MFFLSGFVSNDCTSYFDEYVARSLCFRPLFRMSSRVSCGLSDCLLSQRGGQGSKQVRVDGLYASFTGAFFREVSPLLHVRYLEGYRGLYRSHVEDVVLQFLQLVYLLCLYVGLFGYDARSLGSLFYVSRYYGSGGVFLDHRFRFGIVSIAGCLVRGISIGEDSSYKRRRLKSIGVVSSATFSREAFSRFCFFAL